MNDDRHPSPRINQPILRSLNFWERVGGRRGYDGLELIHWDLLAAPEEGTMVAGGRDTAMLALQVASAERAVLRENVVLGVGLHRISTKVDSGGAVWICFSNICSILRRQNPRCLSSVSRNV